MGDKASLFGISIDALDMQGAVGVLERWVHHGRKDCKYVVTPNVEHVVKLSRDEAFLDAYRHADLVVADGKPIVFAARLLGMPLPGTVPGSDLVPALFEHFEKTAQPLRVFLLGAGDGVGVRAARKIEDQWPHVEVVGVMSPAVGFEHRVLECDEICDRIILSTPDVLVLGLGAPKQELWIRRFQERLPVAAALCVGATIDFLAGEKSRAPKIFRTLGLEWMHRMLSEPRRLLRRYAYDAWVFPRLFVREWMLRK